MKKFCILLSIFALVLMGTSAFADNEIVDVTLDQFWSEVDPYTIYNEDKDPWKGYLTLNVVNNTGGYWTDFHFVLLNWGTPSQVFFVDGDCYWAKPGASNCNPTKSPGAVDNWSILNNGKAMTLEFGSNPVLNGQSVTFEVYTDNTMTKNNFAIGFYATNTVPVVPEPVSSTLFILGGATLGIRRFIKKRSS